MAPEERSERLTFRLSRRELEMIEELAELDGVSLADAIRMALRRAHAERTGAGKKR